MQVLVIIVVVAALVFAGLALAGVWLARMVRVELNALRTETGGQLTERERSMNERLKAVAETLDRRLAGVDGKLGRGIENLSKQTAAIHERFGKVDEATGQMLERAKDLARLEQALRPPKARGGFGELLLENLLTDCLPRSSFSMQHTFASGERVDAVVRIQQLIPVDSKFPLDNFQRMVETQDDAERIAFRKAFARDVRGHIDAIANKYICPAEGTYDFAFMYLPAESVYYELVSGETGELHSYALGKRVIPVSASTFFAYLQVIVLGLRGLQIEQQAQEMMTYLSQLKKDFERFGEKFELVGTHLGRAQSSYSDAEKRLDRFDSRLEQATEHDHPAHEPAIEGTLLDVQPELPAARDAA